MPAGQILKSSDGIQSAASPRALGRVLTVSNVMQFFYDEIRDDQITFKETGFIEGKDPSVNQG